MPVINPVINPATEQEDLKAKGIIKRLIIKRINDDGSAKETLIKNGPKKGSKIVATHRYAVVLEADGDEKLIGFGEGEVKNLKYENQFQVKVGDAYKDLVVGQEISIYPVVAREYEKNGEKQTAYNGKRKDIKILTEAPAGSSVPSQGQAPGNQGGKTLKVFGEITAIENGVATINDEKNGTQHVTLGEAELAQVDVGLRMTAYVSVDGTIASGFKAYGAANSTVNGQSKPKKSAYDQVGVETGHAINGLAILLDRGYKTDNELETAKMIHAATVQAKKAEAERTGKSIESVGSSAGNAILNACRRVDLSTSNLHEGLVAQAQIVLVELAEPLYAFISGEGTAKEEKPAQSIPEPQKQQEVQTAAPVAPAVQYDEPPMDFDDDIPF